MDLQILINILQTISIYLIVAISFAFIYYPTKAIHVSHAFIITLGAYFFYFYNQQINIPFFISGFLSIITVSIIGGVFERYLFYPLRKLRASTLVTLIASLGLYVVMQNLISIIWGNSTKSIRLDETTLSNSLNGVFISDIQVITILSAVFILLFYLYFMEKTSLGNKIKAISSNDKLSSIFGLNINLLILVSVLIASAIGAYLGILVSYDVNMTPLMGFNLLIYGVVTIIISGINSKFILFAGAFLLATAQHLVAYYIGSEWMDAIAYIILILFLIWKPLGFSGQLLKKTKI